MYQNGIFLHIKCNCRVGVGEVMCIGLDQFITLATPVESCQVRAMQGNFLEMEWDMATLWQLRGLRGNYGVMWL